MRIGLDCGGVIIAESHYERPCQQPADSGNHDSSIYDGEDEDPAVRHFLNVPEVPGTIKAVTELVQTIGSENVFLVSKCGPYMEQKIRAWLNHTEFFNLTGALSENLIFVRERKDKAHVCKKLQVTHFVDNHLDVLEPMQQLGINCILFAPIESELNAWHDRCKGDKQASALCQLAWNWVDTNRTILGTPGKSCASQIKDFGLKHESVGPASNVKSHYNPRPTRSKVWHCPACTLENKDFNLTCDACGGQKPNTWECQVCTLANSATSKLCVACNTMRGCKLRSGLS
jgi:hypothetical protein